MPVPGTIFMPIFVPVPVKRERVLTRARTPHRFSERDLETGPVDPCVVVRDIVKDVRGVI